MFVFDDYIMRDGDTLEIIVVSGVPIAILCRYARIKPNGTYYNDKHWFIDGKEVSEKEHDLFIDSNVGKIIRELVNQEFLFDV
jgi:hypothetical protein